MNFNSAYMASTLEKKFLPRFAIAYLPTPVLKTPAFDICFGGIQKNHLLLDDQMLLRDIEMILLPQSKMELLEKMSDSFIWRINTNEHPYPDPLFIDERFVLFCTDTPNERKNVLPSKNQIIDQLIQCIGARYIWGGNWPQGIPQLFQWYTPSIKIKDPLIYDTWQLKGVDCSGLLYFATNGFTPRNTSELISWGTSLDIEGKRIETILSSLLPLDLMVWKGHVIIVLDKQTAIESKGGQGVIISPLKMRLEEICAEKKPVNTYLTETACFVIQRWYSGLNSK